MSTSSAALTISTVSLVVSIANVGLTYWKEINMFTAMPPAQREACRRLIKDAKSNGAEVTRVLWKVGAPTSATVRIPRFDFDRFRGDVLHSFGAYTDTPITNSERERRKQEIAQRLRENASAVKRPSGSTAYSLASMLHGQPCTSSKTIELDSVLLRFEGNRCLFPEDAAAYWALLTTVHTVWDDPADSGPLRARSPWGNTFFFVVDREVFAYFVPVSPRSVSNLQGICYHFDLWDRAADDSHKLVDINSPNFYSRPFAVHMQERTASRIYGYTYRLVIESGVRSAKEIPPIMGQRTKDTYKAAATELLDAYLTKFAPESEATWRNTEVDEENVEQFGDEITHDRMIDGEAKLKALLSSDRRRLAHQDPVMAKYQTFIAAKLFRLVRKAAVYDNRFGVWGCRDGTFWIG